MKRIEELYREFGPMVYRRCMAVLKNEEMAYDTTHEVFLKLMDAPELVARMESPVSYLYRMATNSSLNQLKRDSRRAVSVLVPIEELPDERDDGLAASMLLELLSAGLGERTRTIVYCRFVDGMGLGEIAEYMGLSLSAIRKHLDKFKTRASRHKERIL